MEPNPNPFPPDNDNQPKPGGKDNPSKDDIDDIYKEYEKLLENEKELLELYNSEYFKLLENENKLKIDKLHIYLLLSLASIMASIIIIFSCYELYKYSKNKKLKKIDNSLSKISLKKELLSSQGISNKSTDESNKKNSSHSQSGQSEDLNNESNFNILIKSRLINNKKEEEIIIEPNIDEEEAPININDNKNNYDYNINNNIDNNIINNYDDVKTLTNDENVYFASKTDKLLYKPYSNEEINKIK